ncbi:MAG TPA: alpha/beta hydrolase [Ktedonobacteraceae bacterium]
MLPYHIEGSGDPLLLIHGWGVTYTVWRHLIPLLAPHFQLILVELPGMGTAGEYVSDEPYYVACAESLEELRAALGIEQWAILAYSTGTRAGEAYIQRYPQRVERAVFLCPLYLRRAWKIALDVEQWINSKSSRLASWILSGWRLHHLLIALGFNLQSHGYVHEWLREIALQPPTSLKRMLLELPGRGRTPFQLPASPPVPILFVWGSKDALVPLPVRLQTRDVVILANHGAPVLSPQSVAEVVLPFLKSVYSQLVAV